MNDAKMEEARRRMRDTIAALERLEEVGDELPESRDSRFQAIRMERLDEIVELDGEIRKQRKSFEIEKENWQQDKSRLESQIQALKTSIEASHQRYLRSVALEETLRLEKTQVSSRATELI